MALPKSSLSHWTKSFDANLKEFEYLSNETNFGFDVDESLMAINGS